MKKLVMSSLAAIVLLSGCSETAATEQTEEIKETAATEKTETKSEYAGQTVTGQVTSVSGNIAEVALGQMVYDSETMKPGSEVSQAPGGQEGVPEKPDGEGMPEGQGPQGQSGGMPSGQAPADAPEIPEGGTQGMPEGQGPNGQSGMPQGEMGAEGVGVFVGTGETVTIETDTEVSVGDYIEIVFADDGSVESVSSASTGGMMQGPGGQAGGQPGGFGGSSEVTQGSSANTITENGTYDSETYVSTGDDENALRIDGAEVTLNGITVNKESGSSSNAENGDFYGVNAAVLATNGADVTIVNADISSSAQNGNGVFSYGSGTVVTISDSVINTTADNSGGIQTTGGGTTIASDLTVTTNGSSSAAIRSDRGGGTVNVDGGTYTSNGLNSPAVYSTADITVKNAELTANGSEALVIEGQNSITLENCDVTGNMSSTKGSSSDVNVHNVMIYQSMSGDADVGTSSFTMEGGTLVSKNGDMFYITNTSAVIRLSNVAITNSDGNLMTITGNNASHGWGTAGSNGAFVTMTAEDQTMEGAIVVDTVSSLDLTLSGKSEFTGTIVLTDNEEGGSSSDSHVNVTVESGSVWTLTSDCVISTLENNGTINYNGYTITLADGTVLK